MFQREVALIYFFLDCTEVFLTKYLFMSRVTWSPTWSEYEHNTIKFLGLVAPN